MGESSSVVGIGSQELDFIQDLGEFFKPFGAKVEQEDTPLMIERELDGANRAFVGAQVVQALLKVARFLRRQIASVPAVPARRPSVRRKTRADETR